MIKLHHLDKYFYKNKKNEIHVVNDISLDFPNQGLVILLGPSGSGKTTLLNVLGGLDKVNHGQVEFDDKIIEKYKANVWDDIRNEKVGYIFQNYNLLPNLSVFDNVAFVLKLLGITNAEKIEESVTYILKAVGMYKYRKKKATQLSGGQQQRVAIARALVKNPEVVIADEPTGNLDSRNTLDVMKIIKEISKTKLVVLVTHEKDIAHIYADRIIELKDGKIISDEENTSQMDYEHIDENIVYLKDMQHIIDLDNEQIEVDMYHEQVKEISPIKVRLIVINKTLYLDVDSQFSKVKLLDDQSNLLIKNEHYQKANKDTLTETTFDLKHLDYKDETKQSKILVSFKQVIFLAFQKVVKSTKKGKLLLMSFVFSGAMIALAMALASNFIVPNPALMKYDNDYVVASYQYVNDGESSPTRVPEYSVFKDAIGEDNFVNLVSESTFSIVDSQSNSTFLDFKASVDLISHNEDSKVVEGTLSTEDDEIMISTTLADGFFKSSIFDFSPNLAQSYGIWNYEDLLSEKIIRNHKTYTISGIIKSDVSLIYVTDEVYYGMLTYGSLFEFMDNEINLDVGYKTFAPDELIYGQSPADDEFVLSNQIFEDLNLEDDLDDSTIWPIEIENFGKVSGIVESTEYIGYVSSKYIEELVFNAQYEDMYSAAIYIHTTDPDKLITAIEDDLEVTGAKETRYAISLGSELIIPIAVIVPMILIIFSMTFLGYYFLMHSSMISRIYEISVFRSLGMKKRDLFVSYLVESVFVTTITSLIGYLGASFILIRLNSSPLGFSPFRVNVLTIFLGMIILYGINILAGIAPIGALLRKTP
ncbi:ABC transporter ATP-binding protein/permease [Mycoplasmatota bacterium]|nr:ABC transporter ATP-binding protein/permease [Mycoplasmatota bacterium]